MGLKIGSTFGLYKLVWQAELICALVGSKLSNATASENRDSVIARLMESFGSVNLAPQFATAA